MKCVYNIFFAALCCLFSNCIRAQVSLQAFFAEIKHFVAADYSKNDLEIIKKWSDSSYISINKKKKIKQLWYRGNVKTEEKANIAFVFFMSELTAINDNKSNGTLLISFDGNCNAALLRSALGYIAENNMSFDTVTSISGTTCSCSEIRLHFDNYSPSTNKILERIDTSLIKLLKHEYFDFYLTDLNKKTSKWQAEFKTFLQPHSEVLVKLLERKNIQGIFKLIALKNNGYSWFLAEGLWYYNNIFPCLTTSQMKIINAYNGKKGMIFFRSIEDLKQVYNFK